MGKIIVETITEYNERKAKEKPKAKEVSKEPSDK